MFSGIVEEVGHIERVLASHAGPTLVISCSTVLEGTRIGDSIAVDGVCLTVMGLSGSGFTTQIQPVTARLSTLGSKGHGSRVNLERSVAVGGRIGGHYVQGHVDGMGTVRRKAGEGSSLVVEIDASEAVRRYVVERGFIAVDGASLTVMATRHDGFSVSLVDHTQHHITLPVVPVGGKVNLEVDVVAKYVEQLVVPGASRGVTMESLRRAGFA